MKFLRFLLRFLILTVVLAALLVALAFWPAVQTRWAEIQLSSQPGWQVSIGSLSARFGKVTATAVHLQLSDAVLTLPSLQASLPLKVALWDRKVLIQDLVAKGWTLDLTHSPALADAFTQVSAPKPGTKATDSWPALRPIRAVTQLLGGILGGWNPPGDFSLGRVELEGDVLVAAPQAGREPIKVHVALKGGGLTPGQEGVFTFDADGVGLDGENQPVEVSGHGRVNLVLGAPRVITRIGISTDLSVKGGSLAGPLTLGANIAADRGTHEESCLMELGSSGRSLAKVRANYSGVTHRLEGTWKIDLGDSDLSPFAPDRHLPSVAAGGEGDFDSDAALTRVHARGHFAVKANHLGVVSPRLDRFGAVTLEAQFDLVQSGQSLLFENLATSLANAKPVLALQSMQPFTVDETTGDLTVTDPGRDWLVASVKALPLDWLSGLAGDFTFAGSDAAGEFTAQVVKGGFNLRPKVPLAATGVSLQRGDQILARGLDLTLSLLADYSHPGWQLAAAPLAVDGHGRRLVTLEAKAHRLTDPSGAIAVNGTWSTDLAALAGHLGDSGARWIGGQSASGDFSVNVGAATTAAGNLAVIGHTAGHGLAASFTAEMGDDPGVRFRVPLKITTGSGETQVTAEGTLIKQEKGGWIDLRLSGKKIGTEDLRPLFAPLFITTSADPKATALPATTRDQSPFWADWNGALSFSFDQLALGDEEIKNVRATLNLGAEAIVLENGFFSRGKGELAKAEGSLSFDPTAEFPYRLKAAATLGEVDAASLLGTKPHDSEPLLQGHFAVTGALTGAGRTLGDLATHAQEEFKLTGHNGTLRLLKTSVSGTVAEPSTPVADTLGTAGALVGSIFGYKKNSLQSGEIHLPKNTEAVINFTYRVAEIFYDELTVTATRGSDRTIHLGPLAMTAADEHLTGSGRIEYVEGRPFREEPIDLELELGVRNGVAGFLSSTGLLSSRKDSAGYTLLNQPLHFTGTLAIIDRHEWHDLLVEAAKPKPDDGKKGKAAAPDKK